MIATPRATPMTIPATVPLASRLLWNGAGVTEVVCLAGWLLVEVLGLARWLALGLVLGLGPVLLGVERIGVVISFAGGTELEVEDAPTPGTRLLVVRELRELLFTSGDAEVEAEVELGVLAPGAITRPPHEVNVEPLGE